MVEGYLKKQDNGRYAVCDKMELTCGRRVEVKTLYGWMVMRVEHDGFDYYFLGQGLAFYPKMVYVRYA